MFNGKIIYVDDDEDNGMIFCEVYESVTQKLGLDNELLVFENAKSLLQYFEDSTPEVALIISDIQMPQINGFKLKEFINATKYYKTPFVLYSTAEISDDSERAMAELKIKDYYVKQGEYHDMMSQMEELILKWKNTG